MIVAIIICLVPVFLITQAWVKILDDDDYSDNARFCWGCTCGWCNAIPNDDECKKWRAENGKKDA